MHRISRYTISLAMAMAAAAVQAQDLSTEITVDRIVEPKQAQALRPALMPQLLSPQLRAGYPKVAEWMQPGEVTPLLTRLGVARWEDSIAHTPYRGYLSGGYFPSLNFGADAGYRFVDTQKAWLDMSFQYHGLNYKRSGFNLDHQTARLEAHSGFKPNDHSVLTADMQYRYGRVQEPFVVNDEADWIYYTQNANEISLSADWLSQVGRFSYNLGFGVDHFGYTEASPAEAAAEIDPLKQTTFKFNAGLGLVAADADKGLALAMPRRYGADIDGAFMDTNNEAGHQALWHVRPYGRFGRNAVSGRYGLNLSIASGGGTSVLLSPEIDLAYAPLDKPFAASLSLTGGKEYNSLSDLFAINPYVSPVVSYGFSKVLMDIEASIAVGPVAGFELEAFGGFALPREWLMPVVFNRSVYGGDLFAGVNAESSRLGARIKYSYKSLFSIGASAEMGHSEDGLMTWYRWHDSAKSVYAAWLDVHPISALDISLRWDLRSNRSVLALADPFDLSASERLGIGDAACYSGRVSYAATPQLTVFVNAEIHNKHLLISALPAPTLTGLAGVSYKF